MVVQLLVLLYLNNWNSLEKLLKMDEYISASSFTFIFYHRSFFYICNECFEQLIFIFYFICCVFIIVLLHLNCNM